MYGLSLASGGFIRSAMISRALSDIQIPNGSPLGALRMRHIVAIESLARGSQYSNQDYDVLSAALSFLESADHDSAARLYQSAQQ